MRYLGAKTSLLNEIYDYIANKGLIQDNSIFFDAFSGTGAVAEKFKNVFTIQANDIQYYSFILTHAKVKTPDLKFPNLSYDPFEFFNRDNQYLKGFIWENYSLGYSERMYFSEENAMRIDFIRTTIENWNNDGLLTVDEYYYLIASLLESVSKVANVAGVYGSYLKTWDSRATKLMKYIPLELGEEETQKNRFHQIYQSKLEDIIGNLSGDILYLDPPYTKNQYSVQYHLLETIAKYDNPTLHGKGGLRDTSKTASSFSRKGEAEVTFERIISIAKYRYIILSYSSDGLLSPKFIENVFKRYGKAETFEMKQVNYKYYQNHQTDKKVSHKEYIFFIEKKSQDLITYSSPLNYQGGKYDLIEFIKSNFPDTPIDKFIDVFGGGYNVGINVNAPQIIYNEYNHKVVELMRMFQEVDLPDLVKYIQRTVKRYGLEPGHKEAYLTLRSRYNSSKEYLRDPRMLYLLILYGFNQQIRFNSKYEYNNPVGPSGWNDNMAEKLISFIQRLQNQNLLIMDGDFEETLPLIEKILLYTLTRHI